MLAARIHAPKAPLQVDEIDDPVAARDTVVVDMIAAMVPPAIAAIRDGLLPYHQPPAPFVPGLDGIGSVAEAPAGTGYAAGDVVYCDTFLPKSNIAERDDACFIGNFGVGEDSLPRLTAWRNGCFASKVVLPADCLTPMRSAGNVDPLLLSRLGWLGTVYGAFRRAELRADHSLIITGATGPLGTGAVALALALGMRRIVAVGRRTNVLNRLKELDGDRIEIVNAAEHGDGLGNALASAAGGGADVVVDCVGSTDDPTTTLAAIRTMRRFGVAVLLGNVSSRLDLGYDEFLDKELCVRGSNWFPRSSIAEIVALIESGLLDLSIFSVRAFSLRAINDAIDSATGSRDGFEHIALKLSQDAPGGREV